MMVLLKLYHYGSPLYSVYLLLLYKPIWFHLYTCCCCMWCCCVAQFSGISLRTNRSKLTSLVPYNQLTEPETLLDVNPFVREEKEVTHPKLLSEHLLEMCLLEAGASLWPISSLAVPSNTLSPFLTRSLGPVTRVGIGNQEILRQWWSIYKKTILILFGV